MGGHQLADKLNSEYDGLFRELVVQNALLWMYLSSVVQYTYALSAQDIDILTPTFLWLDMIVYENIYLWAWIDDIDKC